MTSLCMVLLHVKVAFQRKLGRMRCCMVAQDKKTEQVVLVWPPHVVLVIVNKKTSRGRRGLNCGICLWFYCPPQLTHSHFDQRQACTGGARDVVLGPIGGRGRKSPANAFCIFCLVKY